jgi:hypothetical protein
MKRIAILPLDDRPVNYDYPQILARCAGLEALVPPREWLGNPWRESEHAQLVDWLKQVSDQVDGIILAVDTLACGGLIRMRISSEPFESVHQRLMVLREIKARFPDQKIIASSIIQRVNRANSSEEEKPYWAVYGARMFQLSYLEHKSAVGEASPEEISKRDMLKREIPDHVYQDYMQIRRRNHAVNRLMLDWVEEGVLDYLLLPQDDTAEYGWNIVEARSLQASIRARGLTERAITYPGADEIGCLLLARWICQEVGFSPRIYTRFSSSASATITTDYEDRPMPELIKAHLAPLGGILVDTADKADIVLFVNAPAVGQGAGEYQWPAQIGLDHLHAEPSPELREYLNQVACDPIFLKTRREMETPLRSPEEFTRAILSSVRQGCMTAIADVAFVNGSDLILGQQLTHHPEIAQLAAYGGWNTAGNTLGTVLSQAVLRALALKRGATREQTAAHLEFLFTRFLDDYGFQAIERTRCMLEDLPGMGIPPTFQHLPEGVAERIEACVSARLHGQADGLEKLFIASGMAQSVKVSDIYLPWKRLFEVGFQVDIALHQ